MLESASAANENFVSVMTGCSVGSLRFGVAGSDPFDASIAQYKIRTEDVTREILRFLQTALHGR